MNLRQVSSRGHGTLSHTTHRLATELSARAANDVFCLDQGNDEVRSPSCVQQNVTTYI